MHSCEQALVYEVEQNVSALSADRERLLFSVGLLKLLVSLPSKETSLSGVKLDCGNTHVFISLSLLKCGFLFHISVI